MEFITQGRRGSIARDGNITSKTARSYHALGAIKKEILILKKLNSVGILWVPQVIEELESGFTYGWIEGEHFEKKYAEASTHEKIKLALKLLSHAYDLDLLGVIHGELQRPTKNVLVSQTMDVYIIDFERGSINDFSGRNMKAVGLWLAREGYVSIESIKNLGAMSLDEMYLSLTNAVKGSKGKELRSYGKVLGGICIALLVDLTSKYFFYDLEFGSHTLFLEPLLNLGSAWSIEIPHWITWIGALCIILRILYEYKKNTVSLLIASLIIGGALGNSIDRILYGGVRDFIDITSFFSYPIFNLADSFMVIGVILLVFKTLKEGPKK